MAMMRDRVIARMASILTIGESGTFSFPKSKEDKAVRTFLVAVGVAEWNVADSVVRIAFLENPNPLLNDPLVISCSGISLQTQVNARLSGPLSDLLTWSQWKPSLIF